MHVYKRHKTDVKAYIYKTMTPHWAPVLWRLSVYGPASSWPLQGLNFVYNGIRIYWKRQDVISEYGFHKELTLGINFFKCHMIFIHCDTYGFSPRRCWSYIHAVIVKMILCLVSLQQCHFITQYAYIQCYMHTIVIAFSFVEVATLSTVDLCDLVTHIFVFVSSAPQ